jgi:hypothetical protein
MKGEANSCFFFVCILCSVPFKLVFCTVMDNQCCIVMFTLSLVAGHCFFFLWGGGGGCVICMCL